MHRYCYCLLPSFLLIANAFSIAAKADEFRPTAQELFDASRIAWKNLGDFEVGFSVYLARGTAESLTTDDGLWVKHGDEERVKQDRLNFEYKEDYYTDGERFLGLRTQRDFDPSELSFCNLCNQGGVRGFDQLYDGVAIIEYRPYPLLAVAFWTEPPMPVDEVLDSWECDTPTSRDDGVTGYVIKAHRRSERGSNATSFVEIYFASEHGHIVDAIHYTDGGIMKEGPVRYLQRVAEWQPFGDGVFPATVIQESFAPESDSPEVTVRYEFTHPEKKDGHTTWLGFKFPPGLLVDSRPGGVVEGELYTVDDSGQGKEQVFESAKQVEDLYAKQDKATASKANARSPAGTTTSSPK